ncbi:CDF family zinc efflux transporter CzrB [Alicyclobacillus hesperidum subsp. aegles]|uniref:cation diffusion facilitator family transporter n=1 Tax=Alicyclobacillus hesperidum TaxID=89784 RepID=UPI00222AA766|nr:cation diffusion facilitator family transporter [Alicyclobacillus hesperidum]GLG00866.1 CDF family zinc efflux transporter CzrB [Alicyclobacillus hesperidum subsp. aegles]
MMNHTHDAHAHHHHHDHGVFHTHAPAGKMRSAFFLTALILAVEIAGGLLSGSLALLSDAGHVLTDIAAIGLSWYALKQAERPSNQRMTYGYHRAGILAAFLNAITLILIAIWILVEAYRRFQTPETVQPIWMFISAGIGLVINLSMGLTMHGSDNLNVRSAVLHMLGDAAASAAVIVGGIVIVITGWYVVDPLLSVLIALLVAYGAWRIARQTIVILMEGTPLDVDLTTVADAIGSVHGVYNVHDLHVWTIASGRNALSCHIALDGATTITESQSVIREIEHRLLHLNIGHVTIQVEDQNHPHDQAVLCAGSDLGEGHHHHHE